MKNGQKVKTFGFVCDADPFNDRFAWSGTLYKIREGLERAGFKVVWIPVRTNSIAERLYRRVYIKIKTVFWGGGKNIVLNTHRPFIAKVQAHTIRMDEKYKSCDAFFFPGGGQRMLYMDLLGKPTIYYTDATFHIMVDYYWKNLNEKEMKESMELEKRAVNSASLNIRSSQWAADSVVHDCGCEPQKSFVLEFGANIDSNDIEPIQPYTRGRLNVFFSGVDWGRKGGEIAVLTVMELRNLGVDAHLIIAGIKKLPDGIADYDFVENVGFLNKNDPVSYKKYIDCWKRSHLFLLPTQAECSAIVYCESAGFGVPAYTYLTGGTADYVKDGVNGRTFCLGTSANEIAKKIKDDIENGNMPLFHKGAIEMFEKRLSWTAWSKRFKEIVERSNLF